MTEPSRAIFLSYASQDAEAARRICEALRAGGIEVWFDQSELRGGDAWDRQITRQIRDCALFVPIISAATEARLEGYFRREWRLAVDRTRDMADGRAFLVPVVIDGTGDRDAEVPDSFRSVQWTRLPGGDTSTAFVERVSRLLSPARQAATTTSAPAQMPAPTAAAPPATHAAANHGQPAHGRGAFSWSRLALLMVIALAVVGIGYLAVDRLGPAKRTADGAQVPTSAAQPAAPAPGAIPEKSIAVLPFVDMSEKKDQEYFSDGLTEELLDLLAQVPDLRVSARTSSFYFKGRNEDVASIAQKLRVKHVLEGSVRKSGNTVRVTAQLIRADNGYHLWSKTYDRDEKDIFKVQDEIAAAVVAELKTQLLPAVQTSSAREPVNPEAHNQYLLGRQFLTRFNGRDMRRAAQAFRRATEIDPNYAAAWAGFADATYWVADDADTAAARDASLDQAVATADKAIALQPSLAYGYLVRGLIRATIQWDFAAAEQDFKRAATLEPDSVDVAMNYAGAVLLPTGRLDAAVASLRKVVDTDPLNARGWSWLGVALVWKGDLSGARAALNQSLEISPAQNYAPASLAWTYLLNGRAAEALEASQRSSSEVFRIVGRAIAEYDLGHHSESDQALEQLIAKYGFGAAAQVAEAYAWRGDKDHAFSWLDRAYAQRDPGFTYIKVDPLLRKLHGDPRYAALLRKIKLPE